MMKGVQQSKEEYNTGECRWGSASPMYDGGYRGEGSLYTQGIDGGAVLRRRVCQWCDRRGNSKYYKERTK
jgi:hypothetical protein